MQEYVIAWETDYCDDYADFGGIVRVKARNKEDAIKIFYGDRPNLKAIITGIEECTSSN